MGPPVCPSSRPDSPWVVRFGPIEANLQSHELRNGFARVRLNGQSFKVLSTLLEEPGRAVSREELRQRLWPQGTFVDFDHSLNAAVNRLRDRLSDSAEKPRYIETLPGFGYRFVGDVQKVGVLPKRGEAPGAPTFTEGQPDIVAPVGEAKAALEALPPESTGDTPVRPMTATVYGMLAVGASIALLATVAGWLATQKRGARAGFPGRSAPLRCFRWTIFRQMASRSTFPME